MSSVHGWLAWSAAGGIACLLVVSLATAGGVSRTKLWLDRAILFQLVTAIVASLGGLAVLVTGKPIRDPLHLVYGAVLVAAPGAVRYLARRVPTRRLGGAMSVAAIVLAGVVIRSFMTGS